MIKFLEIKDDNGKVLEKLPIRISYYVLKRVKEKHGVDFDQIENNSNFEVYESMLYFSLVKGHKVVGKELKYKEKDMEDLMDLVFFDFIAMIPKFFPNIKGAGGPPSRKK